jgi:hypothetical protein
MHACRRINRTVDTMQHPVTVMRLCRHFQMMLFLPTCFLCAYIAFAGSAEFDMKAAELVRTAERLEHKVYIIDCLFVRVHLLVFIASIAY